ELWLESQTGQGSTFYFTALFTRQRAATNNSARMPANLRALPVLVVDDNATSRRILKEMLRSWHMKPTAVASGKEALNALYQASETGRPFSLALIDGQMPEMDGFTLAERIQQDRKMAGVTIIMLTSAGQSGRPTKRQRGLENCISKPVKQSDLLDAIVSLMGTGSKAEKPSRPAHGRSTVKRSSRGRILLAEDNLVNQELARAILEKDGHTVVVAHNGREALA